MEVWNLDSFVSSILSGDDEIEVGGEGKRLEALHILG